MAGPAGSIRDTFLELVNSSEGNYNTLVWSAVS